MTRKRGFTLIELMIVILIVAVLAAVLIPLMQGRIDRAKWSEANAGAGMINSAVRALIAEKGPTSGYDFTVLQGGIANFGPILGVNAGDLTGRYFTDADYAIDSVDTAVGAAQVTVSTSYPTNPEAPQNPSSMTLQVAGQWIENP
jgi:prepilin-type N-terminal cleavage/methylation domain-containing protein